MAEGADYLCDLPILVEQPSGAVTPSDPEFLEIDHVVGPRTHRRGLTEGSVRAMAVVEALVLTKQPQQMLQVPDQGAVGSDVLIRPR
jgi:hypothetical protein